MVPRVATAVITAFVLTAMGGCGGGSASNSAAGPAASSSPSAPSPTLSASPGNSDAEQVPKGWASRKFGEVSLATPSTWAPIELQAGKLVTRVELPRRLRNEFVQDLEGPGALVSLVDTETLKGSFFEMFITEIFVSSERSDEAAMDAAELAAFARQNVYVGPDAPKDVKVSVFEHPTAPAIQARYTGVQDGFKLLVIEYTLAFPGTVLHLDLSTDRRNPGADIATSERIVRSARIR